MSVINTNVTSLLAQNVLATNNSNLSTSLERLSTGLQINSGADNPAGYIAVQSFNQENTGLTTALNNASLAGNVIGTAQGGLGQVSDLLTQLQGLVGQAANSGGVSSDQIQADQLQVNSILNTINRIANGTNFQGIGLLNGNLSYVTSGVKSSALQNLQINSAQLPDTGKLTVNVDLVTAAKQAEITSTTSSVSTATTLQINGNLGSVELTFTANTKASAIASEINGVSSETGVTASAALSGTGIKNLSLISSGYGASQFVSVTTSNTTGYNFAKASGTVTSGYGSDAVVTVNGTQANAQGNDVSYSTPSLDFQFDLATQLTAGSTETFGITGGGANFAIGAQVNDAGVASIGISSVSTANLGDSTDGYLDSLATGGANELSSSNLNTAQKIITAAINQVSSLSGRLGAFQDYTIGSTVSALNVAYENSSAAESAIADTNFASETSNLTRAQILSQAATTVLAQANARPQQALTLLQNA
ncbi:MAG TPA: flagellin [Tepidisphaeraceae bacterium]|nr:flagellin [Tepidisphaeraceae bacterium]